MLNLSIYSADAQGAAELISAVRPKIVALWKQVRVDHHSDDLIADIDVTRHSIQIAKRSVVKAQIQQEIPDWDLIEYLESKPPQGGHGSIRIWVLIRYRDSACVVPLTLASS